MLLGPISILFVEGLRQATPADVLGKNLLFFDRSGPPDLIERLDQSNCIDVGLVLGALSTGS